jgi:hypothetical protein
MFGIRPLAKLETDGTTSEQTFARCVFEFFRPLARSEREAKARAEAWWRRRSPVGRRATLRGAVLTSRIGRTLPVFAWRNSTIESLLLVAMAIQATDRVAAVPMAQRDADIVRGQANDVGHVRAGECRAANRG